MQRRRMESPAQLERAVAGKHGDRITPTTAEVQAWVDQVRQLLTKASACQRPYLGGVTASVLENGWTRHRYVRRRHRWRSRLRSSRGPLRS